MATEEESKQESVERSLQALHSEIEELRRQVGSNTQRLNRFPRLDELEPPSKQIARLDEQHGQLVGAMRDLTHLVEAGLTSPATAEERTQAESEAIRKGNFELRTNKIKRGIRYLLYLSMITQVKTYICPCGKHLGIRFIDESLVEEALKNGATAEDVQMRAIGVIEANVCPVDWWFSLSRLAYESGNLAQWRQNNSLPDFLENYNIAESIDE